MRNLRLLVLATNSSMLRTVLGACYEFGERLAQGFGFRGAHHRRPDANEKRVAEQIAQAGQRMACRRLRKADALARAPYMRLVEQRLKHDQQVHVDGG